MTQQIGTGWMISPPKRQDDDAAFNQLIDKMDLEQARRMMCPKSNGNPEKCKNCDGFRTCKAGQRVARLITENIETIRKKTEPVYVQKWKEDTTPPPAPNERDEFRKACESGNAWHYLMETKGLTKDAAGELLSKLIRRFPGIAADFGGGRRIMQRPKVVKIMSAVEPRVDQEPAPEPKVEEIPAKEQEAAKQAEKRPKTKRDELNAQIAEEARERCRQILATGDPVQALVNEGKTEQQARARINKWKASYPDLFEGIDPAIYRAKRGRKKKEELMEQTEADHQIAEPVDDEVSLSDFLTEYGAEPQVPESDPEPQSERTGGAMDELEAKYNALEREKQEARERIKWIEEQQEALEKVISMFR